MGKDPDTVWRELGGHTFPASGMLARAEWHLSSPGKILDTETTNALRDPAQPNLLAWLNTLRNMTKRDKDARASAIEVVELSVVFMTQTTSVERFLGLVKLTELKCRAHKLNVVRLGDAIKIAVQDLAGRRLAGQVLDPVKLLVAKDSGGIWRASPYCIRAQNIYRELFGERALHCRSCEVKATTKDPPGIPPLGKVKQPKVSSRAFAQRLVAHSDAVGACAPLQAPHC